MTNAKKLDLRSESGFTLMELIIVIGIIGILIAILIPQFNGYTDKANAVAAKAEHKNVLTTVSAYSASLSTSARQWNDGEVAKELGRLFGLEDTVVAAIDNVTQLNDALKGGGAQPDKGIVVGIVANTKTVTVSTVKGELTFTSTLNGSTGQSDAYTCGKTGDATVPPLAFPRCEALKTAGLVD